MRKLGLVVGSGLGVLVLVAACSSKDDKPATSPGTINYGDPDSGKTTVDDDAGDTNIPETCKNGEKNGRESDVDCGGDCLKCVLGKACKDATDCVTGATCSNNVCAQCNDNVTNGDETDVDCGGKACGPCTVGKRCKDIGDCGSGNCAADACACPANMAIVALASGGAYCIDKAEVSKGQYNKFVTANVPVNDQDAPCGPPKAGDPPVNSTFVPRDAWPPATAPGGLDFNLGLPVHYVDWCDAAAYCKWAKKKLCGSITGAALPAADINDASKSAWFNACSAQNSKAFPYGTTYEMKKCNDDGVGTTGPELQQYGYPSNKDTGVYQVVSSDATGNIQSYTKQACQGGSVGLFQMSGNVAEWDNSCGADDKCIVRGGSYKAASFADLGCESKKDLPRMPAAPPLGSDPEDDVLADIGIRCCVF